MGSGELRHDVPHPYNTESRTRCASRGLWLTFDTGGEPLCPRCEGRPDLLQWQEHHSRKLRKLVQAGGNPCHSNHKKLALFQKKPLVLLVRPFPKETCLCGCAMNWARSTRMKPLLTYFRIRDSLQKPPGA